MNHALLSALLKASSTMSLIFGLEILRKLDNILSNIDSSLLIDSLPD